MKPINLDTYSLSLLTAKEDILNPRSSTSWALFKYDGSTNNLKLSDSGAGGVSELIGKFEVNHPLYGLCRVEAKPSVHRIVMITWVGEGVDEYRRTECLSHVPAVKAFFKEAHVFVSATRPEDVTEEKISEIAGKIVTPAERIRRNPRVMEKDQPVGTNYRKTNAAMEIRRINRDSFWARAEREEEERKEDERRRAAEDRRRWERERIQQERREAEERDRKMDEKLQMIEEQRRMQANLEAEVRKQERAKWEQQQKEHEEDMRARFRRSESIEKAAEAAVLVSQRSINPREFFRQLSSSSTDMPPSPSSPRTGKPPFRRYQRSLTDTAFIFGKSDSSVPPSPHSPTVVSPFSRIPKSPFNQPKSPTSPSLADTPSHCLNSTPQPRDHLSSPLTSPKHSAPTSTLPSLPASKTTLLQSSLPHSSNLVKAEDHILSSPGFSTSFVQPLAAPASLGLLISLSQPHKDPCGSSGSLNSTAEAEDLNVFPQTDVPLESEEDHTAYRMLTALDTDADMTVKAVLVDTSITPMAEEDEEEAEVLELVASTECKAPLKNLASTLASEESVSTGISILSTLESTTVSLQEDSHVEEKTSHRQECAPDMEAISTESRQCMENLVPVLDSISTVTLETNTEPLEENPRAQLIKTVRESQEDKEMSHSAMAVDHFAICQEPIHVQQTEVEEEHNTVHDLLEEHIITEVATEEDGDQMTVLEEVAVQQAKVMCDENTSQAENGLTEGHNGTEQSINPHGMVKNLSEITQDLVLTSCTIRHDRTEEDFIEEMVENEKSSPHEQLCVRALYDYQAEDESELSLEPGDIISAVETVDKAWWRGCSKDGRQGLFPANYVETIKGLPSI